MERALQAGASAFALVIVAADHARAQGRNLWQGLRDIAPTILAGVPAVGEAFYLDPDEDES